MPPLIAGALTALFFATATLASARASRRSSAAPAVALVMAIGAALLTPVALIASPLGAAIVPTHSILWAVLAGVGTVSGLVVIYGALRIGAVGVVSTIVSTEGAIAAVVSVIAGQTLVPGTGPTLALIVVGVVLAATGGGREVEEGVAIGRSRSLRAAAIAAVAACLFGFALFAIGRAGDELPAIWIVLIGRVVGVAFVGLPLVLMGRMHVPRAALPYLFIVAVAEVGGYTAYAIGAGADIALTAVLGSMFAPTAAVAAFVLFRERLAPRQVGGIVIVAVGIVILAVITA